MARAGRPPAARVTRLPPAARRPPPAARRRPPAAGRRPSPPPGGGADLRGRGASRAVPSPHRPRSFLIRC
jgi:hypothetical protein